MHLTNAGDFLFIMIQQCSCEVKTWNGQILLFNGMRKSVQAPSSCGSGNVFSPREYSPKSACTDGVLTELVNGALTDGHRLVVIFGCKG